MFGLIRKMIVLILFVIIASAVAVYFCNLHIKSQSKEFLYDRIEDVPETDVALVPGTVSTLRGELPTFTSNTGWMPQLNYTRLEK